MISQAEATSVTVVRRVVAVVGRCKLFKHTHSEQLLTSYSPSYLVPQARHLVTLLLTPEHLMTGDQHKEWRVMRTALGLQLELVGEDSSNMLFKQFIDDYEDEIAKDAAATAATAKAPGATEAERDKAQMFDTIFTMMGTMSKR